MPETHIKEVIEPTISANELAAFLVEPFPGRERIIQRAHWQRRAIVVRYKAAKKAISQFLSSPSRDRAILEQAKRLLEHDAERPNATTFVREDARASIAAIESFERGANQMGLLRFNYEAAPTRNQALRIEGVKVNVTLDRVITQPNPGGLARVGGLLLRAARGTDIESENAASKRRAIGRNAAVIVHLWALEHLEGRGEPRPELCLSVDIQHQEAHHAPRNAVRIANEIRSACRFIRGMWDQVPPPNSN